MNAKRVLTLRGYAVFAVFGSRSAHLRVLTGIRVVRQSDGVEVEWRQQEAWGHCCRGYELQRALEYGERWIIERGSSVPLGPKPIAGR